MTEAHDSSKSFKEKGRIKQSMSWGLAGLFLYVIFLAAIVFIIKKIRSDLITEYDFTLWTTVFVLGVTSSVWGQYVITAYFHVSDSYQTITLSKSYAFAEKYLCQPLLAFSAAIAISTITLRVPFLHFGGAILYLSIVIWLDWVMWEKTTLVGEGGKVFKARCGQLFWHVDFPAFVVILLWVSVVAVWHFIWRQDGGKFVLLNDLEGILRGGLGKVEAIAATGDMAHSLSEPLLAGAVGFHMVVTVILLMRHLYEWENTQAPGVNLADGYAGAGDVPLGKEAHQTISGGAGLAASAATQETSSGGQTQK